MSAVLERSTGDGVFIEIIYVVNRLRRPGWDNSYIRARKHGASASIQVRVRAQCLVCTHIPPVPPASSTRPFNRIPPHLHPRPQRRKPIRRKLHIPTIIRMHPIIRVRGRYKPGVLIHDLHRARSRTQSRCPRRNRLIKGHHPLITIRTPTRVQRDNLRNLRTPVHQYLRSSVYRLRSNLPAPSSPHSSPSSAPRAL